MYNSKLYFHFIGIGGVGMSGIAEILLNLGYRVSGSDLKCGDSCKRLSRLGAKIIQGHDANNLPPDCSLVVYSSAVSFDNPEIIEAQKRGIPVVRRAEVLAELIRMKYGVGVAGSHGKTSTTEMIGKILEFGDFDPTVIIGGRVKSKETGSRLGHGDYLVAECDESDRSFLLLKPTMAVVTNIDAEHLNAYSSITDLEDSFAQFVNSVPFYGVAILCIDDQRVRALANKCQRRKITYGISPDADLQLKNLKCTKDGSIFDVVYLGKDIARVSLPLIGRHFALNSLAAFAVGLELGIPVEKIVTSLQCVQGVQRRLEVLGCFDNITIISDYAHHPTEIKASLNALKESYGKTSRKIQVIFEPHRYSRLHDCFSEFIDAFNDADRLIITSVYSAGEKPIEGVSAEKLASSINSVDVSYVEKLCDVMPVLLKDVAENDVIVCMGAGSIGAYAHELTNEFSSVFGYKVA